MGATDNSQRPVSLWMGKLEEGKVYCIVCPKTIKYDKYGFETCVIMEMIPNTSML
jgi:hypothetical protein